MTRNDEKRTSWEGARGRGGAAAAGRRKLNHGVDENVECVKIYEYNVEGLVLGFIKTNFCK